MTEHTAEKDAAERERITEELARAMYVDRGHDLDRYPWEDETANIGYKQRYRDEAARLVRIARIIPPGEDHA